jgi:O-antigen/teichoic acid export membrane protein
MAVRIPRFLRHASLYSLGTIMRNAASLLLLPVYTRYLTPAEYGLVELITVMTTLVGNLVSFDLNNGVFRYYNHAPSAEARQRLIMAAMVLGVLVNAAAGALLALCSPLLAQKFLGGTTNAYLLAWFSLSLVLEAICAVSFSHMRVDGKVGRFLATSTLRLVTQIAFNLYFLVVLKLGAASFIYGYLISCAIQVAAALPYTLSRGGLAFARSDIKRLVSFGGPLAMAGLATLYISTGDRFFLSQLNTLAAVGVYALAYRLAQALNTLVYAPFTQVWEVEQYRIHARPDMHPAFGVVFQATYSLLACCALGLALFAPDLLRLLATPAFYGAAAVVPILVLALLFSAMTDFARLGSLVGSRPINVVGGAMIGAILVTGCLIILVPRFGSMGAATAVAIAALARLIFEYRRARRLFDMELHWGPLALTLALCAAATLTVPYFAPLTWIGILAKGALWFAITVFTAVTTYRRVVGHPEQLRVAKQVLGRGHPERASAPAIAE